MAVNGEPYLCYPSPAFCRPDCPSRRIVEWRPYNLGRVLFALLPRPTHETRLASTQNIHGSLQIPSSGFWRFQRCQVAKNFLFSTWDKHIPGVLGPRTFFEFNAKPTWHGMHRSGSICIIEGQIDDHAISYLRLRGDSDYAMQI